MLPPVWFLNAVRDVEENFPDLFFEEVELAGAGLGNVNLDTGRPDLEESDYGGLHRAFEVLRALGADVASFAGAPAALPNAAPEAA